MALKHTKGFYLSIESSCCSRHNAKIVAAGDVHLFDKGA